MLILLAILAVWFALQRIPWRERFLWAGLVFGVLVVLSTEAMSAAGRLDAMHVKGCWLAVIAVALACGLRARRRQPEPAAALLPSPRLTREELALACGIALVAVLTLVMALRSPPNNCDSMTYHMPRVMHWRQDHNVGFYPTYILRQLFLAPFAEYIILHLQFLADCDRWANLVQWSAMVGSAWVVALIAMRLGADRRGQWLAALAVVTLRMGVLQATSTQTDYVVTLWLACWVYFCLRWQQKEDWVSVAGMSAALALAIMTKATAYFYAAPFGIWVAFLMLWRWRWRGVAALAAIGFMVVLINAPFWARVYALLGSFVSGGARDYSYQIHGLDLPALLSNVLRNLGLHLGTTSPELNEALMRLWLRIHHGLGLAVNDPRITWPNTSPYFQGNWLWYHEDTQSDPLHLFCMLTLMGATILGCRRWGRLLCGYSLCLLVGMLLLCVMVKWSPWHARLHLGWLVLGCPLLGVALGRQRAWARWSAAGLFFLLALPPTLCNASRPLLGGQSIFRLSRTQQFYLNESDMQPVYKDCCGWLQKEGATSIGFLTGNDDWEYPFWRELARIGEPRARLEHVMVQNESTYLESHDPRWRDFSPDFILATFPKPEERFTYHGHAYALRCISWGFRIYGRVADTPAAR